MEGQMLTVANNWLETYGGAGGGSGLNVGNVSYYQPWNGYPSYLYYTTPAPRPIKLTLSEVERLRKLAKADDKVKAILVKFTDQIEIVVDFE